MDSVLLDSLCVASRRESEVGLHGEKDHGLSPSPARVGEVRVPKPQEGSGKRGSLS